MSINKAKGNMYDWADYTHNPLGGRCPHECKYCYVDNPRFGRAKRYQGAVRLLENELKVKYEKPGTYFICTMNDLFGRWVPIEYINEVLSRCRQWPDNTYIFQSKNPIRFLEIMDWPKNYLLGTTIETNRSTWENVSYAPNPYDRYLSMKYLEAPKFVTLEPLLDFDEQILLQWIIDIQPEFVNIGADSKGHGLNEPDGGKVRWLIRDLREAHIEVLEKSNLERLTHEHRRFVRNK
jgi:protein gp37